jgi:hypothetical protein
VPDDRTAQQVAEKTGELLCAWSLKGGAFRDGWL